MKKIISFLLLSTLPILAVAQQIENIRAKLYGNNLAGVPTDILSKKDVVGTAFLNDTWTNAIVKTQKDEIYKDIKVKYNVLEDLLYFLGEKDVTMGFVLPIKEFSLLSVNNTSVKVFRSGFPKISDYGASSFYQVLTEGKILLLKKNIKRIAENREYNSAVTVKEIIDNTKYFLYQAGKMREVKKDKSFILSYFNDKNEIKDFIANKKIEPKKEEDLIKLVNYYNTL
jgi:hypothetical protein